MDQRETMMILSLDLLILLFCYSSYSLYYHLIIIFYNIFLCVFGPLFFGFRILVNSHEMGRKKVTNLIYMASSNMGCLFFFNFLLFFYLSEISGSWESLDSIGLQRNARKNSRMFISITKEPKKAEVGNPIIAKRCIDFPMNWRLLAIIIITITFHFNLTTTQHRHRRCQFLGR